MQERMAALGVAPAGSASPKLDTSVEDRLALEKKEAEEKARAAEKEAEERERIRKERLESEKALKGTPSPAPPAPSTSGCVSGLLDDRPTWWDGETVLAPYPARDPFWLAHLRLQTAYPRD